VTRARTVAVDGGPYALAAGPDGAMWVTLVHAGAVARIGDTVTVHPVGAESRPSQIVAGPDGALWFTRTGDDHIGRVTVDGDLTGFALPAGSGPYGITAGADGALWFTAMTAGFVGSITVDGAIETVAHVGGGPAMITRGPDGALWFTLNQGGAVGRLDTGGAVTVRELPTRNAGPVGIAATHDDAVWFTEISAEKLGRIPMGEAIQEVGLPGKPHAVVADTADGVWVTLWGSDQIARVSGDGEIVTLDLPPGSEPHGIALGPDGVPWVALESGFVVRLPG
jgi:virginiamycin B lyase